MNKRNHKKAVLKRRIKLRKRRSFDEEAVFQAMLYEYAEKGSVAAMPTLVDALSQRDTSKDDRLIKGKDALLEYFNQYIETTSEEHDIPVNLPDNVLSFVIPLDYYIPLPSPYNATTIAVEDDHLSTVKCVSVISDIVTIEDTAVKISYLIASICDNKFSSGNDISEHQLSDVYVLLVRESNNVIAGIQAIPSRHNHYMHPITPLSPPSTVNYFIFNRTNGKTIKEGRAGVNGNVKSEIFHARALNSDELGQFRTAHINKTFADDKIFELVSKYNQATNTRCFGNDDEAIILADNFTELTLGYIYCQAKLAQGLEYEEGVSLYAEFKSISDLVSGLADTVGYSITKFKKDAEFDKWYSKCRLVRNDIAHRFMTDKSTMEESLEALYYAGNLINKVSNIFQIKFPKEGYNEFFDKLELLKSTSYVVSTLHKGVEQGK